MSLLNNLEHFVNTKTDDLQFNVNLKEFLRVSEIENPRDVLKERIQIWKAERKTDEEVRSLISDFIRELDIRETEAVKFMLSNPLPNLVDFKRLSPGLLAACLVFDKSQLDYRNKLVYKLNEVNADTEFIIWLIERGFEGSSSDTHNICKNRNLDLLKYYQDKKIITEVPPSVMSFLIDELDAEFIQYILDNNLIEEDYFGKNRTFELAIRRCINYGQNRIDILKLLFSKNENLFKRVVVDKIYTTCASLSGMGNAKIILCSWLWTNDMKWNMDHVKIAGGNPAMLFYLKHPNC